MYSPHRLDTPPPSSQFRPRPWSPDLARQPDDHTNRTSDDDRWLSSGYQRQRREASDISVEALDLADYAPHLHFDRQTHRPAFSPEPDYAFAFRAQVEYPPSPPPVRPFAATSRPSLQHPSLVSSRGTLSSQSHAQSYASHFPARRPSSLPPTMPSPSLRSADRPHYSPYIAQSPPVYEHPESHIGEEFDITQFPPWSRSWYPQEQRTPKARPSVQEASPAFFDPTYPVADFSSPYASNALDPYSMTSDSSSQDVLPWSQNDRLGSALISEETKEERMRMLEREFGTKDMAQDEEVKMIGGVDVKGKLVTHGPKKRGATRIVQGLLALGTAIATIYAALEIKPSTSPPPRNKPQTYVLYVLSVVFFIASFYLYAIRPCCCGRRKSKGLLGRGPGGMMILPVQGLPGSQKKKGKKGGQGQGVQVNLIVDPTMFGQGHRRLDQEEDALSGDENSSAVSGVNRAPGRRPKRRSVFEGLAMEEQWKQARKELKWFLFFDLLGLGLWGVEFVWILIGPRCPPGDYDGWCTAFNLASACTCLLCVTFGISVFFDIKDLHASKSSPRTRT